MNDHITIILINWNGKKWLEKCLDSLTKQSYKNLDIILFDNNSSDNSVQFVKKHYPRINLIISKENLGFANANDIAIKSAKEGLILIINTDVWVERDFVEKLASFYNSHDYDVISPREALYDGSKQMDYISTIDLLGHSVYLKTKNSKNKNSFYLTGVCLLFPRKLYESTGGFDTNFFMYCEEVDWFWRLQMYEKKYSYVDNIYIYHKGAGSTGSGIKYNVFLWRNQNTLQMLLKNYEGYNLIWVLPLYVIQNIGEMIIFVLLLKPQIASTYIKGWMFNIKNIKKILEKRRRIQKERKVSDFTLIKNMYLGFGKIYHLFSYLNK